MNQPDDRPQPIHPQNSYNGLGLVIRLSQRLGCHNATHEQEEQESTIVNTGTRTQVRNASHAQSPRTEVPTDSVVTSNVKHRNVFFENSKNFTLSGNPSFQSGSITNNNYGGGTDATRQSLEKLEKFVLSDAQFDSAAQDDYNCRCYPGTRKNILGRLRNWIDDPDSIERISWLHGPAGAGKSAIARTIARFYRSDVAKVAATFFFRSDVNRSTTNLLITTLAYQIALSTPAIKNHIANALYERPDFPTKGIETQFHLFLTRPFHALRECGAPLAPIIIIDGVDECTDENFQQQFLETFGNAVKNDCISLRFLIVSRSEPHIKRAMDRFQLPILCIDLAEQSELHDADQEIEQYLADHFSEIALDQGLDPTWPGPQIIETIKRMSSGNFLFPSLVIKCLSDPENAADNLLQHVLNNSATTAFAKMDQLFLRILRRVTDQDFLKSYLVLLVARISISSDNGELYKDDAMLMRLSENELRAKLFKLNPLLKTKPTIDVHHLSFLHFLHDKERSGQYCIPKQGGIRQYLEVFVGSFFQYVSAVIEKPDHDNKHHFNPTFRAMMKIFPSKINLSVKEWQEVTRSLLNLQDKLLQSPTTTWDILRCKECTVFHVLRELLYLGQQLENLRGQPNTGSVGEAKSVSHVCVVSSITSETEKNTNDHLDSVLLPLLAYLREAKEDTSPNEEVLNLVSAILGFDHAMTAARVRLVSDAQKLVDLLVYLIEKKEHSSDATRNATLLAIEIFARVPIIPLSPFSKGNNNLYHLSKHENIPIQVLAQTIFVSRVLDRRYIVPVLVTQEKKSSVMLASGDADCKGLSMKEERKRLITSPAEAIKTMLRIARAIHYFHSVGVLIYHEFGSRHVFLDKEHCPKIHCLYSIAQFPLEEPWNERFSCEGNVSSFGYLFYELFTGDDTKPPSPIPIPRRNPPMGTPQLEIPKYARLLIQQCCAQEARKRPTMASVLQIMENWKIE